MGGGRTQMTAFGLSPGACGRNESPARVPRPVHHRPKSQRPSSRAAPAAARENRREPAAPQRGAQDAAPGRPVAAGVGRRPDPARLREPRPVAERDARRRKTVQGTRRPDDGHPPRRRGPLPDVAQGPEAGRGIHWRPEVIAFNNQTRNCRSSTFARRARIPACRCDSSSPPAGTTPRARRRTGRWRRRRGCAPEA